MRGVDSSLPCVAVHLSAFIKGRLRRSHQRHSRFAITHKLSSLVVRAQPENTKEEVMQVPSTDKKPPFGRKTAGKLRDRQILPEKGLLHMLMA
jgi:hypothetical protein